VSKLLGNLRAVMKQAVDTLELYPRRWLAWLTSFPGVEGIEMVPRKLQRAKPKSGAAEGPRLLRKS
jgi:hypothetical protein